MDNNMITEKEIGTILDVINTATASESAKAYAKERVIRLATQAFTNSVISSLSSQQYTPRKKKRSTCIKFTMTEINQMPDKYRKIFACKDIIVPYRIRKDGVYEARVRKKDLHIEVSSRDLPTLKKKFLQALEEYEQREAIINMKPADMKRNFGRYTQDWLNVKQHLVKATTFAEYSRLCNCNLIPAFGEMDLMYITREMLQNYLLEFVKQGKNRTAEKLSDILRVIFDLASDDFNFPSPMRKVVLPKYQVKSGTALTKAEEKVLVNYCLENREHAGCDALIMLLYFGMRRSELSTMKLVDDKWLEVETSKERLGRNVVIRRIPITPMARKYMALIDFEKAKSTNINTIATTLKRILPTHHTHELRHTFISRCKESGVSSEVVSIWAGHSLTGTITTTVYTHYSDEFQLKEAEKVVYELE